MHRLYLIPTLLINVVIILIPALLTITLAFFRWDGIGMPSFIGLGNFENLAEDRTFWTALGNNLFWTLIFMTVPIAMGLLAATMLMIVPRRGSTFFQVVYFLPVVIATAITARVWQGMIYSPVTGVLGLLDRMGVEIANPLSQPPTALVGVAIVDLWHWWGFLCVIFFAALRQVPQEQIEAAKLEGASFFQMMWYVLLPGIRPTITLMMVMTVIWSFLVFDFVYILTQGGPAFSSEVLSTLAYRNAFYDLNVGQAAAVALVISCIGLVATFFYIRIQAREYEHERLVESRTTLTLTYIVLGALLVVALFPIALLVLNSLKPAAQIVQNPLALPEMIRWDNFTRAWKDAKFSQTFFNSALLTALTIILVCSTSSLTAYVLARRKIKAWKIVTFYLLATTTAPIQLFLFPLYFGFAKLGLINNVFAVAVIYTAIYSPFAVMLLRTYFLAVPRELEEAALVDGANHWQVFTKVMLPVVSPGILTVALIIGLYSWNEFLIATTFLQKADKLTAVVSFFLLSGQYSSDWGEIMAAALIIVLPVVVLFVLLQKRFIEGMAGGSVKG